MIRPLKRESAGRYRSADDRFYFWRDDETVREANGLGRLIFRPSRRWDMGRVAKGEHEAFASYLTLAGAVKAAEALDISDASSMVKA